MRVIGCLAMVSLLVGGVAAGCEASSPDADAASAADVLVADVPPATRFTAVLIRDDPDFLCSANARAHGADIDAVQLLSGTDHVSWWADTRAQSGDDAKCDRPLATKYKDARLARGGANATFEDNYVALSGGWIIGTFSDGVEIAAATDAGIASDYTFIVYEVGEAVGGKDEPYSVYLASGLDCAPDFVNCTVELTTAAVGKMQIAATPF